MPAVPCEAAFLAELLSDLDSSVFDALPSSSQTGPASQSRRLPPAHTATLATRSPRSDRLAPPKRQLDDLAAAKPKKRVARENALSPKPVNRNGTSQTTSKRNVDPEPLVERPEEKKSKTAPRIALGGGKENQDSPFAYRTGSLPGQVAAVQSLEMEELLREIDWDEEEKSDGDLGSLKLQVPYSQRYLRCIVENIREGDRPPDKILSVSSTSFEGSRRVLLSDDWLETEIEVGDTINLVGDHELSKAETFPFVVNRDAGLLILHPDILVSATKVADSSHCTRKALLQEIIRTSTPPTPSLVYGNMLHELLQKSLLENRWDEEFRSGAVKEIVARSGGALWSIDISLDVAREQLLERSEGFLAFAARFVGSTPVRDAFLLDSRVADSSRSRLAVLRAIASEEDIWSPRLGLKGKIDVSLEASIADPAGALRRGKIPFEIKTGRANAGMEHRAQTMLYTLLTGERYNEESDSGLLYYTQSNEVYRVQASRNELRGLIHARNRFASILHNRTQLSSAFIAARPSDYAPSQIDGTTDPSPPGSREGDVLRSSAMISGGDPTLLPAPIDEERSCLNCYASDACMVFRRAVEAEPTISDDPEHPLEIRYREQTSHLTDAQAHFFAKWEELIRLEEREMLKVRKEIWTMTAEERATSGRFLAGLEIDHSFVKPIGLSHNTHRFVYRLRRRAAESAPPSTPSRRKPARSSLAEHDPIVISLENTSTLALSRGFVLGLEADSVVVGLDRSLSEAPWKKPVNAEEALSFRIDKDELATGMGRIRNNLLQLFVANGDGRRRALIVDLDTPRFNAPVRPRLIPTHLNLDQQEAVRMAVAAQDYALILGMPGTGKTTVIAELLKLLVKSDLSILLTSYTHSAVDNILLKVKDAGLNILRLGSREKILPSLHHMTLDPDEYPNSLADIDDKLMRPKIVATTALGISDPIFHKRRFDVCIVDEASQLTLPTCLGPIRFCDKFILVGDHNQLPPLVRNRDARDGGFDVSLFKRLSTAHPEAIASLTLQYRMNNDIMVLSNELVYDHRLRIGNRETSERTMHLPSPAALGQADEWLQTVLDPSRKVIFFDTDGLPARERKNVALIENETEARIVFAMVETLAKCRVPGDQVGVITLYRQQIQLLERKLRSFPSVEILTADRSQGRDKECIIISCVRSNESGQVGDLLKDWRRINVCLSRAKSKLIVIGSRSTLAQVEVLSRFFHIIDERNWGLRAPPSLLATLEDESGGAVGLSGNVSGRGRKTRTPVVLAQRNPLLRDLCNHLG